MDAIDEEGVVRLAAAVLERAAPRRTAVRPDPAGDVSGCTALAVAAHPSGFAGALVVPERPAAEQQEQREDRELGGA